MFRRKEWRTMNRGMSSEEQLLWKQWNAHQHHGVLNEIIAYYTYLVDYHSERISSHLPNNVSKDDIRSFGLLGLYDAVTKFESKRNLKFDTYASFRIKGAIIDGLRKEDWLPRSLREKTKRIERTAEQLEQQLQRTPTSKEIGKQLDLSEDEVESIVKDSLFANVLSIEEKSRTNDEFNEGIGYTIPDENAATPEEEIYQEELKQDLLKGIKGLNEREQLVIDLFYHQELTFTEIGQTLNLTTSRISQIHKKAIFTLRNVLTKIVE